MQVERFIPPRNLTGAVYQAFVSLSRFLTRTTTPTGAITPFAGSTIPAGWLLCDGSSVSRTQYPDLFTAIGTTWGSASGSTFNVPDLRGRTLIGAGTGTGLTSRVLAGTGGEENHVLITAETPMHACASEAAGFGLSASGFFTDRVMVTNVAAGHNNMQPWAAVNYMIRA